MQRQNAFIGRAEKAYKMGQDQQTHYSRTALPLRFPPFGSHRPQAIFLQRNYPLNGMILA
jgi:hypothetical protein